MRSMLSAAASGRWWPRGAGAGARLLAVCAVLCARVVATRGEGANRGEAGVVVQSIRGLPPSAQLLLHKTKRISCDGGKKIAKSRINDEYCDCEDGRDEPGTSACAGKAVRFWCRNKGFMSQYMFTSRVDDGICGEQFNHKTM